MSEVDDSKRGSRRKPSGEGIDPAEATPGPTEAKGTRATAKKTTARTTKSATAKAKAAKAKPASKSKVTRKKAAEKQAEAPSPKKAARATRKASSPKKAGEKKAEARATSAKKTDARAASGKKASDEKTRTKKASTKKASSETPSIKKTSKAPSRTRAVAESAAKPTPKVARKSAKKVTREPQPEETEALEQTAAVDVPAETTAETAPDVAREAARDAASESEPAKPRRRKIVAAAPTDMGPEEISVADLLDDDDELEREAERVATELEKQQDDEETPEPELPTDLGPVFEGEVDIDTPEQRLAAMDKAAPRIGIPSLHAEQREVIDSVLAGNDVLMVLPTGFGKSACYQIPSMIHSKPVLVISPLLALMRDQYEKLQRLNVPCVRLDGTIRGGARKQALAQVAEGGRVLVMTTPETLAAPDLVAALEKSGIAMAAIDEAHCISEWGFDFRPAYLQIGERLRALGGPPVLALTATATEKVRVAIQRFLAMRDPHVVSSSPHRENLAFDVLPCGGGARHRALVRLALRVRRPGIIYCTTTREVDEMYAVLQRFGIPSHRYHGKMTGSERSKSQDSFMHRGRRTVMVATNAFGLGIDKPDIRYVMHYQSPASLEQYVQEAGRAGRDGRRANCIMLFSHEDRTVHEALLSRSRVRPEQLYKLGRALAAWASEEKVPSLQALALSAELGTRTAAALCALLEEATLVRWDQSAVFVTVPADEIEARSRTLAGQFETLRTQDARRLDAVTDYATTEGCRAVFLRDYFGEEGGDACGMCDRCRGQEDRPSSFWQPLAPPKAELERRRTQQKPAKGRGANRGRNTRGRKRRSASGGSEARSGNSSNTGERKRGRRRRSSGDRQRSSRGNRSNEENRRSGRGSPAEGQAPNPAQTARPEGQAPRTDAGGEESARMRRRRRGRRGGRGRRTRRPESDGPDRPNPS